jgi:hydrogenase-4 component B
MLAIAHLGAFTDPHALAAQPAFVRSLLAGAALLGFGTKAGLMPFHSWLPRAHPAAPGHISAVMSGVMIKVALYGLARMLFEWLSPLPGWVAPVLLGASALSCVAGVLYALMQHELKRLLAFHSVENVGIIGLGLAASLLAAEAGQLQLAALAFAAAMLHTLNHALFKSLLFLCAGSFQRQVGKLDLDRLGGLLRTMPLTGTAFLAGSMAIAGVPPFNGFASEWLTLQALVQLALHGSQADAAMGALAAAALAATAALAVFCFVKVVGLVLLGAHRQKAVANSREVPATMTGPVIFLAGLCLAIGVVPAIALGPIGHLSPYGPLPASATGITLAVPGSGTFAPLAVAAFVAGCAAALQLARRRAGTTAPSPMWICGQVPDSRLAWTSAGFTKSLRLVLAIVLRPRRTVSVELDGVLVHSVVHESEVPHLFDDMLFRPALSRVLAASQVLRRTQSGSLRAYLTYLLVTLGAVLAVVRLGTS